MYSLSFTTLKPISTFNSLIFSKKAHIPKDHNLSDTLYFFIRCFLRNNIFK
jgi:hypothetical protein